MSIYKEPPPGMFVVPDPHDMTKVRALELVQLPASPCVAGDGCRECLPKRSVYSRSGLRGVRVSLARA